MNRRKWDRALIAGAAAYDCGKQRSTCPGGEVDDPLDTDDERKAAWLYGWDEAQMQDAEIGAATDGRDAFETGAPCPHHIERLKDAWLDGWNTEATQAIQGESCVY